MPPAKLQPAILGGLFMGVLSALPFVGACCCLWIVGGGALAAYLMQQNHPLPITVADGALVGLLSGVFGAVMWTITSIPVDLFLGDIQRQTVAGLIERLGDLPPDFREMLNRPRSGLEMGIGAVIGLMFGVVICAAFGTLGGVLGASMFRKDQPPGTTLPPTTLPPPTVVP
jgi:hypothetical protein